MLSAQCSLRCQGDQIMHRMHRTIIKSDSWIDATTPNPWRESHQSMSEMEPRADQT